MDNYKSPVENHWNMTSTSKQFPNPQHSGRVPNVREPSVMFPFQLFAEGPVPQQDLRRQLVPREEESALAVRFFSKENIDLLQSEIAKQVYMMSGNKYQIDRQDDVQLKLIMRSYYMQFARHNDHRIDEEMTELNARVVGYASGKVFSEVSFYKYYIKDLEEFPEPIHSPLNVNLRGTKNNEFTGYF